MPRTIQDIIKYMNSDRIDKAEVFDIYEDVLTQIFEEHLDLEEIHQLIGAVLGKYNYIDFEDPAEEPQE